MALSVRVLEEINERHGASDTSDTVSYQNYCAAYTSGGSIKGCPRPPPPYCNMDVHGLSWPNSTEDMRRHEEVLLPHCDVNVHMPIEKCNLTLR